MRDIIFRAKTIDDSRWKYGDLITVKRENLCGIKENSVLGIKHLCKSGTIGEYTGLSDKNGTKIFEGDIVSVDYDVNYTGVARHRIGNFKVVFKNGCFMKESIANPQLSLFENNERKGLYHFIPSDVCTIIGNIYDNPELLAEGAADA